MRSGSHRRARRVSALAVVAILMALSLAPVEGAPKPTYDGPLENVVLEWNGHASDALINATTAATPGAGQTPPVSTLYLAMVHGAIYDAVNAIDRGHQPYIAGLPPAPRSASKAAAVAKAAHYVLRGVTIQPPLSPGIVARLDGLLDGTIKAAVAADGQKSVDEGIAVGAAAAAAMLAKRADDGRYGPFRFTTGDRPGEWRPVPNASPPSDPNAWVAKVTPFAIPSAAQFRTAGPHPLTSEVYAREYNEVKALGGPTAGSPRTPEQEALAQFYVNMTHGAELFNRTFRIIAAERKLTLVEQARLFAMINIAGADAIIACWDDKAHWNFWRPITAIREGENDGNPQTASDPNWTSLISNPPYPEHPSGYNCVAGGYMHAGKAFFGTDQMNFKVVRVAPNMPDVTRDYGSFTGVVNDVIEARLLQGIHFRASNVQGAKLGQQVAEWQAKHYFGAMPGLPSTGAGGGTALPPALPAALLGLLTLAGGWVMRRRATRR
jgi:hypothetical protein